MSQHRARAQILDLDLGNTRLKYRCAERRGSIGYDEPLPVFKHSDKPRRIRVASVLGDERNKAIAAKLRERYGCEAEFAVSEPACAGVRNGYDQPATLGVDRWLAVVAAFNRVGAALVVDLGTAATFDYVDDTGKHLGGFIVPGLQLLQQALVRNTESVHTERADPLASAANADSDASLALGSSTRAAVLNGAQVTLVRLIEAEIRRAQEKCHPDAHLLLCGGGATQIAPDLACAFEIVPDLVLDGLGFVLR